MKQSGKYLKIRLGLLLLLLSVLGGCSGYGRPTTDSGSGVEMYGTIDVGVRSEGH
jgi:hypothetical protein